MLKMVGFIEPPRTPRGREERYGWFYWDEGDKEDKEVEVISSSVSTKGCKLNSCHLPRQCNLNFKRVHPGGKCGLAMGCSPRN